MEYMSVIPNDPSNPCDPSSTNGDEPRSEVLRSPSRNSTELTEYMFPADIEALLYHNLDSSSDDIGFESNNVDPVYPFRFLDLPLELQLEVVEILSTSHENCDLSISMYYWRHPLLDFRQANKHLSLISTPRLFSKLNVAPSYCEDLEACAPTLGPYVKSVTITIEQGRYQSLSESEDEDGGPQHLSDDSGPLASDQHLIGLLRHLPNITALELIYPVADHSAHAQLLAQLATYGSQITTVILRQQGLFGEHYNEVEQSIIQRLFFDTLCHSILQSFPNLRVFEVHSAISFTARVLAELRATAQNIQKLFVRMGVGLALRPLFSEITPWSCGINGRLRELTLRDCKGGHLGVVVSHLATGVFGPGLRIVNLVVCGYPTDDEYAPLGPPAPGEPPRRVKWDETLVPKLDRVHIDHTEPWELWALAAIRTREVVITRSDRRCVVAMFERPGQEGGEGASLATWIGLERLSVRDYAVGREMLRKQREEEEWALEDEEGDVETGTDLSREAEWNELDQKLAAACDKRGVKLTFGGDPWGTCTCHLEG